MRGAAALAAAAAAAGGAAYLYTQDPTLRGLLPRAPAPAPASGALAPPPKASATAAAAPRKAAAPAPAPPSAAAVAAAAPEARTERAALALALTLLQPADAAPSPAAAAAPTAAAAAAAAPTAPTAPAEPAAPAAPAAPQPKQHLPQQPPAAVEPVAAALAKARSEARAAIHGEIAGGIHKDFSESARAQVMAMTPEEAKARALRLMEDEYTRARAEGLRLAELLERNEAVWSAKFESFGRAVAEEAKGQAAAELMRFKEEFVEVRGGCATGGGGAPCAR
jgi:pyruvate dehydrogenase E2 component (dihydrolipoamide acetyltransferase)